MIKSSFSEILQVRWHRLYGVFARAKAMKHRYVSPVYFLSAEEDFINLCSKKPQNNLYSFHQYRSAITAPSTLGVLVNFISNSLKPVVRPSVRSSVSPSVRPSLRPSVCPSVRLSVRPSVCLSVRPFVHLSVCSSVRSFVCPTKSSVGPKGPSPPQELE